MRSFLVVLAALALSITAPRAHAFCGFYVAGADAKLFNNATMVVMMRDGMRTVLSMQNNYQGPPERFAMVVPVPVVLQKENVRTLPNEVFDHVDKLAAPRLVEYWEEDPCYQPPEEEDGMAFPASAEGMDGGAEAKVKIEAQFKVGEYDVVVLSATDSTGLEKWLLDNEYSIPNGAEPVLRPYVEGGSKFFVAKVDVTKVRFEGNQAMLSPLRFDYESQEFSLPVRLGLINSAGTQDVIVHILAKDRYEVANYKNVTIPTNIDVNDTVRDNFGAFYAALFDETMKKNPGAVVTEYAWAVSSCDPCPTPPLEEAEVRTLGGDVIGGDGLAYQLTVTRLHARYDKAALGDDLVFRKAKPIAGGREVMMGERLETGSREDGTNNFQARYAIRHPWEGAIECDEPHRGNWGGPPDGNAPGTRAAQKLAFAPRDAELASFVEHDIPEIGLKLDAPKQPHAAYVPPAVGERGGCASCAATGVDDRMLPIAALAALLAAIYWRRRE